MLLLSIESCIGSKTLAVPVSDEFSISIIVCRLGLYYADVMNVDDWGAKLPDSKFTNFFTDVRIAQIRNMQEIVAEAEGLQIFHWDNVWEGYQSTRESCCRAIRTNADALLAFQNSKTRSIRKTTREE